MGQKGEGRSQPEMGQKGEGDCGMRIEERHGA
jgi:hypothetical protein